MDVSVRDLRNDTRSVIDAVERGDHVVLTRRGRPVARIVPIDAADTDIETWLTQVTSGTADTGLLDELLVERQADRDADDRRMPDLAD